MCIFIYYIEFDITSVCNYEADQENFLEVVVLRYSDGYYLEDQDMFNLSGIFRSVTITSLPQPVHIQDYSYKTYIDTCSQSATLDLEIKFAWNFADILNSDTLSYTSLSPSPYSSSILGIQEQNLQSYALYLKTNFILNAKIFDEGYLLQSIPVTRNPVSQGQGHSRSKSVHGNSAADGENDETIEHTFVFSHADAQPVSSVSSYVPVPPINEWTDSIAEHSAALGGRNGILTWDYARGSSVEATMKLSLNVPYVNLWTVCIYI